MSELDPAERATKNISQVFSAWLRKEFKSSNAGNNSVLDKLDELRAGMSEPINMINMKYGSHRTRMEQWFDYMPGSKGDQRKQCAALITFGGMMFISGMYRNQRYIDSTDQEDYYDRKWFHKTPEDPIGINIPNVVGRYITRHAHADGNTVRLNDPSLESLHAHALGVLDTTAAWNSDVIDLIRGQSFEEPNPAASARTRGLQAQWIAFATHSVLQSAGERGNDLTQAPVLAAKSITHNPGLIQPFGSIDANNNALLVPELAL